MIPDPLRRFVPLEFQRTEVLLGHQVALRASEEALLSRADVLFPVLEACGVQLKTIRIIQELPEVPHATEAYVLLLGPLRFMAWGRTQMFLDRETQDLMVFAGPETKLQEHWAQALARLIKAQ